MDRTRHGNGFFIRNYQPSDPNPSIGKTGQINLAQAENNSNASNALTNLTVVDDKLGSIASAFTLLPGEVRSFTKVANIGATTTNRVDVQGTLNGGGSSSQTCTPNDSLTVTVR